MAEVDEVIKRKFVYWPTSNIGLVYHMFEKLYENKLPFQTLYLSLYA